ncbi:uncharacterized protein [Drosophila pseudoobscura]|uniref:Uncharacterized protein n=1 Tax=Drosophila pseudoobscura pseudoobscura TaxID=46245 RepID=A0A6I8WBT3_DROPS|nr:uncharacterized protein LOC6901920 [Drosophila pseudoobscura]
MDGWNVGKDRDGDRDRVANSKEMVERAELCNYCPRHEVSLPVIEIVQQNDTPKVLELCSRCSVASIKRYGKSNKKRIPAVPTWTSSPACMAERRIKFPTDSGQPKISGRKYCDANNYYKNFLPHLKKAAFGVINSMEFMSETDQLLSILKITHESFTVPSLSGKTLVKA